MKYKPARDKNKNLRTTLQSIADCLVWDNVNCNIGDHALYPICVDDMEKLQKLLKDTKQVKESVDNKTVRRFSENEV